MRNPVKWIGEQWTGGWADVSRTILYSPFMGALRSFFSANVFTRPRMDRTVVTYDIARSLYRNDNPRYNLGAGFIRPIIDLPVEYIGLPSVSCDDNDAETMLNEAITDYWGPQILQMFRDSMRDSKVIVRYRQPLLTNPLFTEEDRTHGRLELIPPEECAITYDPTDPDLIERAVITHWIRIDTRTEEQVVQGTVPMEEEHEIIEIITPESYSFFDKTSGQELPAWKVPNTARFAPVWECWNEYASDLGGGQSDIEPVLPFIEAFHEVLDQTLASHKYHSTPKAKFNVKNVESFIKNNWPDVLDENGRVKAGASIDWSGRQVMFFESDEDAGFIEAQSVLGDSKTLLDFLIDCIAIASETPRWALLAANTVVPETDASVQPFEKKIERKRVQFAEVIVMICKMALAMNGKLPITPRVTWQPIRLSDLVNKGQAIQQIVLAMDAASQHEWLSDETAIKVLADFFPQINAPDVEKRLAANNVVPLDAIPAPASPTQALPPGKPSSNGSGSKTAAKKALSTTSPSKS